jgi:hypothetical protein
VEVVKNVEELSALVEQLVRSCSRVRSADLQRLPGSDHRVTREVKRLPWRHGGVTVRA